MAFHIPKIEYLNDTTTGDVASGSGTITNVADIEKVQVGMDVAGLGIPAGAKVGSLGASSFTLADGVLGTGNNVGATLTVQHTISFDYPPQEPKGERLTGKGTESDSISGKRQTSTTFVEGRRTPVLSFLSPAIWLLVREFMISHALYGRTFRYYDDKLSVDYIEYELENRVFDPEKIASRAANEFVWRVPVTMRRAL